MSQITLEFNNSDDENFVLSLLQRLGISFSMTKEETPTVKDSDYYRQIIQQGVKTENFEDFMREFEENRQDRNLPFKSQ
jgi:hypothetical protein